jgi:putative hemolysin
VTDRFFTWLESLVDPFPPEQPDMPPQGFLAFCWAVVVLMAYTFNKVESGGGHAAASVWRQVKDRHLASIDLHVRPRLPLPVDQLDGDLVVEPPALIKGYLRLGAKVLGPPAWDPDFNAADLPMLMRMGDLPARYRKHFLGAS